MLLEKVRIVKIHWGCQTPVEVKVWADVDFHTAGAKRSTCTAVCQPFPSCVCNQENRSHIQTKTCTQKLSATLFTKAQNLNNPNIPQKLKGQSRCSVYNGIWLGDKKEWAADACNRGHISEVPLEGRSCKQGPLLCAACLCDVRVPRWRQLVCFSRAPTWFVPEQKSPLLWVGSCFSQVSILCCAGSVVLGLSRAYLDLVVI